MTKTYLALALLITVLAGNAYGEAEVYYCAETDSNGFNYDEKLKEYSRSRFRTNQFKMKLDRASNRIELAVDSKHEVLRKQKYACIIPYPQIPDILSCHELDGSYFFNFNIDNGRFARIIGSGYVFSDGDSLAVAYGKCDKF